MFKRFFTFLELFGNGYEIKLVYILFMTFMSALLEFLSIVLVFPFIMIMVNPGRVVNNPFAIYFRENWGIEGINQMIMLIGGLIATVIIIKNIYSVFILYWQNKTMSEWGLEIKEKMLNLFLYSPYEADLKRGELRIMNQITLNIDNVMQYYIFKILNLISNTILIALVFTILFYLLPSYTLIAILFFSIAGLLQSRFFTQWGNKLGDKRYKLAQGPYNAVVNNLECIKDIKINGCQKYFYDIYKKISTKMIPITEKVNIMPAIPQYIIEIIFILTMIILCLGILAKYGESPSNVVITMGVIAIAIYRIIPQIYKNQVYLNYINLYSKNIDLLFAIYNEYNNYEYAKNQDTDERIQFNNQICVRDLNYSYDKEHNVLNNINLEIKKGDFIGIVGLSGAGKTTLVDCILGLLTYQGSVYVDDTLLTAENIRTFRNIIGYVPQKITTVEGDIYSNVAWGIDKKDIDKEKVEEVLKAAQLYDQLTQTENGLDIEIKQDGTGLSFGQKQRIGIARALYRDPEIIVLDEATSNLDVKVENKLTEIINQVKGDKTVIAIAHRLSTIISCDKVIYLDKGEVVDMGTFHELSQKYPDFEEIVKLSRIKIDEEE